MPPRNFRIVSDRIYAGAAPTYDNLKELKQLGIKYILSLDAESGNKIKPYLPSFGMQQILVPIDASSTIVNDNIKYLVRNIDKILINQPIYIHCLQGQDRTGFAVALFKVKKKGENPESAIADVRRYGYGLGISPKTQKLWSKIITLLKSNTPDVALKADSLSVQDGFYSMQDISGLMHEIFRINDITPAVNMMHSFGPRESVPYQVTAPSDFKINEVKITKVPQIGIHKSSPVGTAGAVEFEGTMNIFQY